MRAQPARVVAVLAMAGVALGACDDGGSPVVESAATSTSDAGATTTTAGASTSTAPAAADLQPALWPAPDVAFSDPVAAATDFLEGFFPGSTATLSEFRQGDARSGEIEVFRPREGGGQGPTASTLSLRQLGEQSGWFVIAATNPTITIDSVESGATVPAAPLVVSGVGRGFEATLNVIARPAGGFGAADLDLEIAMGGAFEESLPYEATMDLSAATGTIALVVRGDTGLDGDPGEFTAIPLVIG